MIYAIGDLHGLYDPLKIVLNYIREEADQGVSVNKVIFLGDYIDCGPSSKEVIDLILQFRQDFDTVSLLGNHEQMLLSYYNRADDYSKVGEVWLLYNGGLQTVRSFYPQSVLFSQKQHLSEREICELIPSEEVLKLDSVYEDFFNNLSLSCLLPLTVKKTKFDFLFSHSVPNPNYNLEEQLALRNWADLQQYTKTKNCFMDDTIVWNRQLLRTQLSEGMVVIHGHTPTLYYLQSDNLWQLRRGDANAPFIVKEKKNGKLAQIDIDTGLIYGGALTLLAIDDAPEAENPLPYYLSVIPAQGLRKSLYSKTELNLF